VRDGATHIEQALDSLRHQSMQDFEVLVVNDGSSDSTPQILQQQARRDGRLRILTQPPRGIVAALQLAACEARGSYLARMDADDISLPRRLERQVAWLDQRPELAAVSCLVRTLSDAPLQDGWKRYIRWLNARRTWPSIARDLFVESPLPHPSVVIRRSALEQVGGYRQFDGPEDYDLWLRLVGAGWRLAKVPTVLLWWRDHPRRLTRTDTRYRPEAFIRLKAQHLSRMIKGQDRPLWIWGAGRHGRLLARALESREGCKIEAFIDIDPMKIGRMRRGSPVVPVQELEQHRDALVLAAVPVDGARSLIRRRLTALGFQEGLDYWCCA
jgi:glycosyltransferase involved in cell wall biosynthesis